MKEETERLVDNECGSQVDVLDECRSRHDAATRAWKRRFYVVLFAFMTYVAASIFAFSRWSTRLPASVEGSGTLTPRPYSPANDALVWEQHTYQQDPDSHVFMGPPGPELDMAWHELLEGTFVQVTEEELALADNSTSVQHKDGGYVTGLGVTHSLHCLKRIKQYMHPEYYYKDSAQDWNVITTHMEHCLEGLRQAVMCHADTLLWPLEWSRKTSVKPEAKVTQMHTCANWKHLQEWTKARGSRRADMLEPPPEWFLPGAFDHAGHER